jgi:hypothetical protein
MLFRQPEGSLELDEAHFSLKQGNLASAAVTAGILQGKI